MKEKENHQPDVLFDRFDTIMERLEDIADRMSEEVEGVKVPDEFLAKRQLFKQDVIRFKGIRKQMSEVIKNAKDTFDRIKDNHTKLTPNTEE